MARENDELLEAYIEESQEHLSKFEECLLELENDRQNIEIINTIFRSVHSMKGGAGFLGLEKISRLSHVLESLMIRVRSAELVLESKHLEALFRGLDKLKTLVSDVDSTVDIEPEIKMVEALFDKHQESPDNSTVARQKIGANEVFREVILQEKVLADAISRQMELYGVVVDLDKDIFQKGKKTEEYISELQKMGDFVGSYPELKTVMAMTEVGDQHSFYFVYSTILEPDLVSHAFDVAVDQFSHIEYREKEYNVKIQSVEGQVRTGPLMSASNTKSTSADVTVPTEVSEQPELSAEEEMRQLMGEDEKLSMTGDALSEAENVTEPKTIEAPANETKPSNSNKNNSVVSEPVTKEVPPKETVNEMNPVSKGVKSVSDETKKGEHMQAEQESGKPTQVAASSAQVSETIRVKVSQLNKLVNLAGELVLARNQLLRITEHHAKNINGMPAILQNINIIASELQEDIMNTRMQPISIIFNKFTRVIHDLGKSLNKKIVLKVEGETVELDKTIIELLSDPLTHIIRNSADHGLEPTDTRIAKGKPEEGYITLKAYHMGGLVNIDVIDDGKGMDPDFIAAKAVEKGLISADEARHMPANEKTKLIFAPGFSTAEKVTDVSGRGVGMDVVLTNVKKLGGTIDIDSVVDKGTRVHMTIPLTLAIVSSLIIKTENERFAIPQANIEELVRIKEDEFDERIARVRGGDVLKLRGNLLPLLHLADGVGIQRTYVDKDGNVQVSTRTSIASVDLFEKKKNGKDIKVKTPRKRQAKTLRILVVRVGNHRLGIIVDEIIGSEEIVVKPMPEYLRHLSWYAGSTILGDGKVALIIDVLGFSNKNKVKFDEIARAKNEFEERDMSMASTRSDMEKVDLLIFNNGTEEQFAVPIALIKRIDEVETKKLEKIGSETYIDYQGHSMQILHLQDFLNVRKPQETNIDRIKIIIPKERRKLIGIYINQVVDTKNLDLKLEKNAIDAKGVLGTIIIDEKITLLVDLDYIIDHLLNIQEGGAPKEKELKKREKKNILLVEDTTFYLNVEKDYIASLGHNVITAMNGQEALDKLNNHRVDVVVTDIEMPVMNGFDLAASIRSSEKYKDVPILAVTSVVDDKAKQRAKDLGFTGWLQKLSKSELEDELTRIFGGKGAKA